MMPGAPLLDLFQTTIYEERLCCDSNVHGCPKKTNISRCPKLLRLPVQHSRSLQQCMAMFLGQTEDKTIDLKCRVGACQSDKATLHSKLNQMPEVLIIQLKRTMPNLRTGNGLIKLDNEIDVPLQYQPKARGPIYHLTGALHQISDGAVNGHYVNLCRDIKQDVFIYSDDNCHPVEMPSHAVNFFLGKSYMFIYSREDAMPQSEATSDCVTSDQTQVLDQQYVVDNVSDSDEEEDCCDIIQVL